MGPADYLTQIIIGFVFGLAVLVYAGFGRR